MNKVIEDYNGEWWGSEFSTIGYGDGYGNEDGRGDGSGYGDGGGSWDEDEDGYGFVCGEGSGMGDGGGKEYTGYAYSLDEEDIILSGKLLTKAIRFIIED